MSYIKRVLEGGSSNTEITTFLTKEGFKQGSRPFNSGYMYYVASGSSYNIWFTLHQNLISSYVEYEVGGEVDRMDFVFLEDDFESFFQSYISAVDWAKRYIQN